MFISHFVTHYSPLGGIRKPIISTCNRVLVILYNNCRPRETSHENVVIWRCLFVHSNVWRKAEWTIWIKLTPDKHIQLPIVAINVNFCMLQFLVACTCTLWSLAWLVAISRAIVFARVSTYFSASIEYWCNALCPCAHAQHSWCWLGVRWRAPLCVCVCVCVCVCACVCDRE